MNFVVIKTGRALTIAAAARVLAITAIVAATLVAGTAGPAAGPTPERITPADDSDRLAFQAWFTFLADAQFERPSADVVDCASLVRHAYREALRSHTPEWYRRNQLPLAVSFPDVRATPPAAGPAWQLFRIASEPDRFAEFADAATLIRFNAGRLGRDVKVLQPGDLLYFKQQDAHRSDHLMIFVGSSRFDPARQDWVVYHTGPQDEGRGEVRKTSLVDLLHHPSPRWRPLSSNPAFVGVFRLSMLGWSR